MICGGNNVYPAEVRGRAGSASGHHVPALSSAVPMTNGLGEEPVAVVVLRATAHVSRAMLESFRRERIAAYKVLRAFYVTDSLPLNSTNKGLEARDPRADREGTLMAMP